MTVYWYVYPVHGKRRVDTLNNYSPSTVDFLAAQYGRCECVEVLIYETKDTPPEITAKATVEIAWQP